MTFVEAAVAVLREAGTPLSVEEIAARAVAAGLLSKPGKDPLKSMKARLAAEARKPAGARVVRVAPGMWAAAAEGAAGSAPAAAPERAESAPERAAPAPERAAPAAAPAPARPDPGAPPVPAGGDREAAADAPVTSAALSPEERALAEVYGDELAAGEVGSAYREYRDELTADEDRPLRPEIVPKRGRRRGDRDRRERARGTKRRGADAGGRAAAKSAGGAASGEPARAPVEPPEDLLDAAVAVLRARDDRSLSLRQLVDSMAGRGWTASAPPKPARAIAAALRHDAAVRRARGLRPRVVFLGADRVALADRALPAALADAERALEDALAAAAAATRAALADRLARLPLPALERVAAVYLRAAGWRRLRWIKRIDRSSYVTAEAADGDAWLIGVRIGPKPVDRRGVGELRAGVEAKGLDAGLLLAPVALSAEADDELDADGPRIETLCGDAFAAQLVACGVGVTVHAAPIVYLDPGFFAEVADES